MTGRVWTLTVPAPCEWLTANERRNQYAQARRVLAWRNMAFTQAKIAKLPLSIAHRVRIDAVARFRGTPPVRDTANLHPTAKAVVDGLGQPRLIRRVGKQPVSIVGYGFLLDDSAKHVDGPFVTIGEPLPDRAFASAGELVLTITELLPADTGGAS